MKESSGDTDARRCCERGGGRAFALSLGQASRRSVCTVGSQALSKRPLAYAFGTRRRPAACIARVPLPVPPIFSNERQREHADDESRRP